MRDIKAADFKASMYDYIKSSVGGVFRVASIVLVHSYKAYVCVFRTEGVLVQSIEYLGLLILSGGGEQTSLGKSNFSK